MTIEWILFQLFINTIEVSVLFYLLCSKFIAKYKSFIPILLFIIGNVVFLSLSMFISFKGLPLSEIVFPVLCLMYLYFFRIGNILKKIFWILISFAILFSISFFSITIITISRGVNSLDIMTQQVPERFLAIVIAKTLQIVLFYILAKKKRNFEMRNSLSPIPMVICFIVPSISVILIIFIFALVNGGVAIPEEVIFAVSIGYLSINIVVFVLYEIINKETEKNYILIAKQKQYELTEEHNKQVIEIYDNMREWRHDYANHMQLVVGMLEKTDSGDNNQAIKYIKNLDNKIKNTSLQIATGNLIVDAIVSAKATLASAHNIFFEHNILLSEETLIESTDLCSILSNLLDNAIEACCKLEQNRYINFEMLIFKNQFNIKIINAANGKYSMENGKLKTTKNGDLHGIGMGHVKSIVESYGGILDMKPESESFTTHISIPLSRKSTN